MNNPFDDQAGGPMPGDERLFVKFYDGKRQDKAASEAEGRPVFKTVPWVRILVPGDRNSVVDTYADESYIRRFPKQWEAYKAKEGQQMTGTPLSEVAFLTRGQVEELEYFKVYTVEQLAEVSDALGAKFPTFHEMKRKAKLFVEQAKDSALAQKLGAENDVLKGRVQHLESEIARLSRMFDAAQTAQKEPHVERSDRRPSRV